MTMDVSRKLTKALGGLALATATAAIATAATAQEGEEIELNMAGFYPSTLTQLGEGAKLFADRLNVIGQGSIQVNFFEPGALVPSLEIFDAVATGSIDMGHASSGLWASKNPALVLWNAFPFGPSAGEYLAWLRYGGGEELRNELYHPLGVHGVTCGIIAPEASGWFREEITDLAQLEGLKMRFFGLGGKVMEKLGVEVQLLAGGDIYPALERGTIDATEFSMPAIDQGAGLYQIAKHYYFPGWHQQATPHDLIVNKGVWDGLNEQQKALIETTCDAVTAIEFAQGEAIQFEALQEMEAEGVTIHKWTDEQLETFRANWEEVLQEEIAANEDFARVWEHISAFREDYATWADLGYLD
jgi:TRAP-type mannitol/chloroaromatic compound transport system substrate-binding protein